MDPMKTCPMQLASACTSRALITSSLNVISIKRLCQVVYKNKPEKQNKRPL
jgi:hypothetical protein